MRRGVSCRGDQPSRSFSRLASFPSRCELLDRLTAPTEREKLVTVVPTTCNLEIVRQSRWIQWIILGRVKSRFHACRNNCASNCSSLISQVSDFPFVSSTRFFTDHRKEIFLSLSHSFSRRRDGSISRFYRSFSHPNQWRLANEVSK